MAWPGGVTPAKAVFIFQAGKLIAHVIVFVEIVFDWLKKTTAIASHFVPPFRPAASKRRRAYHEGGVDQPRDRDNQEWETLRRDGNTAWKGHGPP